MQLSLGGPPVPRNLGGVPRMRRPGMDVQGDVGRVLSHKIRLAASSLCGALDGWTVAFLRVSAPQLRSSSEGEGQRCQGLPRSSLCRDSRSSLILEQPCTG